MRQSISQSVSESLSYETKVMILHLTVPRVMNYKHPDEFIDDSGLLLCRPVFLESLRRGLALDLNYEDVIIASCPKSGNLNVHHLWGYQ